MNELLEAMDIMYRVMCMPFPATMLGMLVGGAITGGVYEVWTKRVAARLALNSTK